MDDPTADVNSFLESLKEKAMHTTQGTYVRLEHVEELLKQRREARLENLEKRLVEPPPKTLRDARRRAARDLREALPQHGPPEPGRSVSARETQ